MKSISLRTLSRLNFIDPKPLLVNLRKFEFELSVSDTDTRIRNLRTNKLKPERELREAAIFCYLASQRLGTDVRFAQGENQDYDFVAAWSSQHQKHFTPVQIKELPPETTAPNACLQKIIAGLDQYVCSSELVIAIHLNRAISFDPAALILPSLNVAEIWVFGAISPDQNKWMLCGDLLHSPTITYHDYPQVGICNTSSAM